MTDEERKKLLYELRSASFYRGPEFAICDDAANEIERLAGEVKRLAITPLGVEAAAHAIRLVENSGRSLEECRVLAGAALCGAFP